MMRPDTSGDARNEVTNMKDMESVYDANALLDAFRQAKKTQIIKLSKGFTFLKIKYSLTDTGKVVQRVSRDSVTRMRRKLKKLRIKLDQGEIGFEDVRCAYNSWRGSVAHYDSYTTLKNMDKLFDELFIEPFIE